MRDQNAESLQPTLMDFRNVFAALTPVKEAEVLQCILKAIAIYPRRLASEMFELGYSSQFNMEGLFGGTGLTRRFLQCTPA